MRMGCPGLTKRSEPSCPTQSEIRAVAAMIQDANFPAAQQGASSSQALIPVNQEWETISDLEIAELVGLHLKAEPPPGIGADMWTYFILDLRESLATVVARLYEVETLLDKKPRFWCDQLNSLKYLKGNCLSLFGVVEQYLMDWERLDFHNPAGYTQAY